VPGQSFYRPSDSTSVSYPLGNTTFRELWQQLHDDKHVRRGRLRNRISRNPRNGHSPSLGNANHRERSKTHEPPLPKSWGKLANPLDWFYDVLGVTKMVPRFPLPHNPNFFILIAEITARLVYGFDALVPGNLTFKFPEPPSVGHSLQSCAETGQKSNNGAAQHAPHAAKAATSNASSYFTLSYFPSNKIITMFFSLPYHSPLF
jgi:hypothetical protein